MEKWKDMLKMMLMTVVAFCAGIHEAVKRFIHGHPIVTLFLGLVLLVINPFLLFMAIAGYWILKLISQLQ